MKYLILFFCLVLGLPTLAQRKLDLIVAKEVKNYTDYVDGSDDTTGFLAIPVVDILDASEVVFVAIATDSLQADINFIGRNSKQTSVTSTYTDSLIFTSNTSNVKRIVLKDASVNRLTGQNQVKIGTVFRSTDLGLTSGRTLKWYLWWRQ